MSDLLKKNISFKVSDEEVLAALQMEAVLIASKIFRSLNPSAGTEIYEPKNYHSYEFQVLEIIEAVKKWRFFVIHLV